MRSIISMETVQIECTNFCPKNCSNCTRFCGHVAKPFFMSELDFRVAVQSLKGFPRMIGMQGGEPLFHPQFELFCEILRENFPKVQLGLWTALPPGKEHYREIIAETFEHILINDHTRPDIYHHPPLVAIEEVITDPDIMWHAIDQCWAQESWSASINPRGAFFCEMAASLAMLMGDPISHAWRVESGWWNRIPKDFTAQMEKWCPLCGMACPLKRRASVEEVDDISPNWLELLEDDSPKIARGEYVAHDCQPCLDRPAPLAAYKDMAYRESIAARYGLRLVINKQDYWKPVLAENCKQSIFERLTT